MRPLSFRDGQMDCDRSHDNGLPCRGERGWRRCIDKSLYLHIWKLVIWRDHHFWYLIEACQLQILQSVDPEDLFSSDFQMCYVLMGHFDLLEALWLVPFTLDVQVHSVSIHCVIGIYSWYFCMMFIHAIVQFMCCVADVLLAAAALYEINAVWGLARKVMLNGEAFPSFSWC